MSWLEPERGGYDGGGEKGEGGGERGEGWEGGKEWNIKKFREWFHGKNGFFVSLFSFHFISFHFISLPPSSPSHSHPAPHAPFDPA